MSLPVSCQTLKVPWRAMMTSRAMWANIIAAFSFQSIMLTLDFALPRFMLDVMHYNIEKVHWCVVVVVVFFGCFFYFVVPNQNTQEVKKEHFLIFIYLF